METVKITLVKSLIGRPETQKRTIKALGLRKINHSVEKYASPQVLGMVKKVSHLIKVG